MTLAGLVSILSEHAMFGRLSSDHLDFLAGVAKAISFEPREMIFHEGEPADHFYLIRDGKVAVEVFAPDRGPVTVHTLESGDVLGWSWLIPPYWWHFDAQATMPTQTIAFDAKRVREFCESNPAFGYALLMRFLPIVVQRLQVTRMQLLDLYHVRR